MLKNYRFVLISILIILLSSLAFSQNPIPNAGFEDWTAGNPDNWGTTNVAGFWTPVTQSTISHSGTYAARGEVVNYAETPIAPGLFTANQEFAVNQSFTRLTGYYQMTNNGEDVLYAWAYFYDANTSPVAYGEKELGPTNGGYQQFIIDMDYSGLSNQPVAGGYIYFAIGPSSSSQNSEPAIGSSFLVDDLAFDNFSTLPEENVSAKPLVYSLMQNYPNPFNPSTKIGYSLPKAGQVEITLYNNRGQVVETLVNEYKNAGTYEVEFSAAQLPSGIYFYKLVAGSYSQVRRMVLVK